MIKKISKLKDFGIFQDFTWGVLDEFKKKNLIYGWNYSGKTTLSKLFQILESKDKDKFFSGAEFQVDTLQNGNFTQTNVQDFPFRVKVFNTGYIKRIFTWDAPHSDIEPISFYLGDPAGNIINQIQELETKNERLGLIKDNRYKAIVKSFRDYYKSAGKFSDKAKEIREDYLPRLLQPHEFNKSHFKTIADSVKNDLDSYILAEEVKEEVKKEALAQKSFQKQQLDYRFTENLNSLTSEVKSILEDSAPKSVPFPELDEDIELFKWVQKGISFHKDADECKFCSNKLTDERIENLNAYYSKKLKEIQDSIQAVSKKIKIEREKLNINFIDEVKLAESYRELYLEGIESFKETAIKLKFQLDLLEEDLKHKGSEIFNAIEASNIEEVSFTDDFDKIEKAVKNHNKWLDEFDDRKKEATENILNHYVADFLDKEDYLKKENESNSAITIISGIDAKIQINTTNIQGFNSQLSDMVKGQDELNKGLEILLHRDDIKIEIRNHKFVLERNGHTANDLSEGEKSAIAFSYFLTELKSLREEAKLDNTIVFLDDPVSSLDSNHIFQVRSLLHTFFKVGDFVQLFISTHNFEFFSIMSDTGLFGRLHERPLYFIKRDLNSKSVIERIPISFRKYKSEYVGIFHIIKEFHEDADKENFPHLILLPNALRRFLELYTLMKYPSDKEVDNRGRAVFDPDDRPYHNTKLLHWFSHQNQVERITQHDDKILQIREAIADLLDHIENNDELHWKGLMGN